jgi:hypothetical protein
VNSQSKKPALGDVRVKVLMGLKTSDVSARPAWFVWVVPEDIISVSLKDLVTCCSGSKVEG